MPKINYLTLNDFAIICQELKRFFKKNNDPSPIYKNTYFDKLDMVIASAQRTFDGKDLYNDFFEKAACYFYFINKLHPFNNGNKRISIVSTGIFLLYNKYEFTVAEEEMYQFATMITLSKKDQKTEFGEVVKFIKKNSRVSRSFRQPQFIFDLFKIFKRK